MLVVQAPSGLMNVVNTVQHATRVVQTCTAAHHAKRAEEHGVPTWPVQHKCVSHRASNKSHQAGKAHYHYPAAATVGWGAGGHHQGVASAAAFPGLRLRHITITITITPLHYPLALRR